MTFEQIISDIQNRKFYPIYLLMGEEPYFIDQISDLIQTTVLDESQKAFNLSIIYGKDLEGAQIDNAARRFPMAAEYNVIIVKEAQMVQKIDNLQYFAANPLKSTILVLCYKYELLDKRKKLFKSIDQNGVVLATKKIYEDQVPRWIEAYLKRRGFHIEPGAAMILTDYLGNDLSRVSGEIDKLLITLPTGQKKITPEHIEENSGISKDFNSFELVKALSRRNIQKSNRIITDESLLKTQHICNIQIHEKQEENKQIAENTNSSTDTKNAEIKDDYNINATRVKIDDVKKVEKGMLIFNNIFFPINKAYLTEQAYTEINKILDLMNKYPKMVIDISGHTDITGSKALNKKLSRQRAKGVADYLVLKGINKNRLSSKGYGSSKPMTTNETEEGRKLNRRVEFKVLKVE
jgi:DNA polymerase III delta subunit